MYCNAHRMDIASCLDCEHLDDDIATELLEEDEDIHDDCEWIGR